MNTATLHQVTEISAAIAAVLALQVLLLIPQSKLRPSNRNLRKNGGTSLRELVANITQVGLLQNFRAVLATDGVHYDVAAGRRSPALCPRLVGRFFEQVEQQT